MTEQTTSSVFWISEQHSSLKVRFTLRAETSRSHHGSVGIRMEPSLIPKHAQDKLFFEAIANGINAAIADSAFLVASADFEVEVADLSLSDDLNTYSLDEVSTLGDKILLLAQETMSDLIKTIFKN